MGVIGEGERGGGTSVKILAAAEAAVGSERPEAAQLNRDNNNSPQPADSRYLIKNKLGLGVFFSTELSALLALSEEKIQLIYLLSGKIPQFPVVFGKYCVCAYLLRTLIGIY